jgi:hypothetical protein
MSLVLGIVLSSVACGDNNDARIDPAGVSQATSHAADGSTSNGGSSNGGDGGSAGTGSGTKGSNEDNGNNSNGNSNSNGNNGNGNSNGNNSGGNDASADSGTNDGGSTGSGSGDTTNPAGPDFTLYSLPECSVVPGGSLSGADGLTIFVALRNSGPGDWSTLVPFRLTSDTGLSGGGNAAISTGSSFVPMQVDLRASDYRRTHRFTVTADPAGEIVERDESNNTLTVTVALPGRPSNAQDVPCTSP